MILRTDGICPHRHPVTGFAQHWHPILSRCAGVDRRSPHPLRRHALHVIVSRVPHSAQEDTRDVLSANLGQSKGASHPLPERLYREASVKERGTP